MSVLFSTFVLAAKVASAAPPVVSAPAASGVNDICLAMIPAKLQSVIQRDHPDYVLPRLTDVPADRLMSIANSGDWPCPYVVAADFDGDERLDRAIILRSKDSTSVRIVAARNLAAGWQIDLQEDWPLAIDQVGIEPLEPGLYEQAHNGNAAAELDNLKSIQSDHAGFAAGQAGKSRRAYFFDNEWRSIVLNKEP